METMVKFLETDGFAVKKKYLGSPVSAYEFDISKGDNHLVMQFKYPVDVDPKVKDDRQWEFINRMTSEFNKTFGNKEVNIMDFRNDCMMFHGEATVHINGHDYPIRITDTRIEAAPYYYDCSTNVSFEADVLHDPYTEYCRYDVEKTRKAAGYFSTQIKDVIFNDPATIVLWKDGTKTVVKCGEDDIYDPEKGLTMAITKKLYGNKGSYYNEIKKWTNKYWEKYEEEIPCLYPGFNIPNTFIIGTVDNIKKKFDEIVNNRIASKHSNDVVESVNKTIERDLGNKDNRSPLQRAYDMVCDACFKQEFIDPEEILGYLGQALDD